MRVDHVAKRALHFALGQFIQVAFDGRNLLQRNLRTVQERRADIRDVGIEPEVDFAVALEAVGRCFAVVHALQLPLDNTATRTIAPGSGTSVAGIAP